MPAESVGAIDAVAQADAIEASAWRDMIAAAPDPVRRDLRPAAVTVAAATLLLAPGTPATQFNRVIGLGVHVPATEHDLDEIVAQYRRQGVTEFWVHLSPGARPAQLPQWLTQRGFVAPARRSWAKMLRGTAPPPAIATTLVARLAQPGESGAVGRIVCSAYGMPATFAPWFEALTKRPGWRPYVALDHETAVAAAFLYVHEREAWLGAAGTLAEHRRRGGQGELMARRITAAAALGCTVIATETGEPVGDEPNPSLGNMRRCGFSQVASRLNFACRSAA